jgi:hypothetical protein
MNPKGIVFSSKINSLFVLIIFVFINGPIFFSQTVNPIIGDESYLETFGKMPDHKTDNELRIQTHLKYVETILRNKDVSHLSSELQARRIYLLDLLREYHTRGKFPQNHYPSGERRPCFIDDSGTICAVGYLVEQTAGRETAEVLNAKFQYDVIMDMNSPLLDKWISESGLTKEEIATIQPTYENWFPQPKRHRIGIRNGIIYSSVSSKNFLDDISPIFGFIGGISLDRFLNQHYFLSLDVNYVQLGFNSPIVLTDPLGLPIAEADLHYNFNYLQAPIRIGWQGTWMLNPMASIGLAPSYLTEVTLTSPSFDDQGKMKDAKGRVDELKNTPKFDLGAHIQLGANFRWRSITFQSYFEVQRGLINQTDTDFFDNGKFWHRGASFNVAVKYSI